MPQQQLAQSHRSRHSRSKKTYFSRPTPSLPVGSQVSRHSGSDQAPSLSDIQISILKEKEKRDELEELKRQSQENKELDEQFKTIDEATRAAQNRQADAQRERERLARQVGMNRRIRIKEQPHPHSSVTSSLPEPSLPIAPSASQTLHIPQQPQQSIAPVQAPSLPHIASAQAAPLPVPTLSTLALPYTSHHAPSQVTASSFSNVNAPPANVQAPHGAAVLPDPE